MNGGQGQRDGVLYALAGFLIWGLAPVYFKAVGNVTPLEILCQRVVWTVPITAVVISATHGWGDLFLALKTRKVAITLFISAVLVASNWFVFIYSISTDRVLQASLGYYINPLVNVLLGMIFLRERLRPRQTIAVLLAAAGTLNMTLSLGTFPWISLFLGFSFGSYGLLRKTVKIESVNGLFVETSLLLPLAGGYLLFLGTTGELAFGHAGFYTTILLIFAGFINTVPLVNFTKGARLLPYTTVGLCQYIAPTLHFALAVFLYNESFTGTHLITFVLIWTGLFIYMADAISFQRRALRG